MASRIEQVSLFWNRKEATVESMHLNADASSLDRQEKEEIFGYLPDLKGKKILDLASGIGRYTRYFSAHASHVTSVDLVPKFVEKNRSDHADCLNITYICSDAMNLKIKKGSFDFIFFNWLLLYLDDAETRTLIERIHQWLKPNGELFFRETCRLKRTESKTKEYYVNYRPYSYYKDLIEERFVILNSGHIKTYIDFFGDPLHEFWHARKRTYPSKKSQPIFDSTFGGNIDKSIWPPPKFEVEKRPK